MRFGQTTARLILSAALLASAGCVSRNTRSQFADFGDAAVPARPERAQPTHHKAQLLAAARQYEKEGRPDLAVRYYRQALAADGQSPTGKGSQNVAQLRSQRRESGHREPELVAAGQPQSRPRLRSRQSLSLRNSGIDKRTAQLIANAAARATAEAIANAASKATDEYLATMAAPTKSQAGESNETSHSPLPTAVAATSQTALDVTAVATAPAATVPEAVLQPVAYETSHGHQESSVHVAAYTYDREPTRDFETSCEQVTTCDDKTVCECKTASDEETAGEAAPSTPESSDHRVADSDHKDAGLDHRVADVEVVKGEAANAEVVKAEVANREAANREVVNVEVVNVEVVTSVADELATVTSARIEETPAPADSQALPQVIPRDWGDHSRWRSTSLTRLCHDANAAVLREVAKLDSGDPKIRNEGLRALANMGPDASSATLAVRMLLHDDVDSVRAHAAWATWALTGDAHSAGPLLTELLDSADADVVQFAAYSLSGIGERAHTALPTLNDLLETEDKLIRVHAAEALVRIAAPASRAEAIDTLILMTADPSAPIRVLALLALGKAHQRPTASMTTALTSALHDSDAVVRAVAALTLGGFGSSAQSTIAQLEFVAASDQQDVQQAAATALNCIRR